MKETLYLFAYRPVILNRKIIFFVRHAQLNV